MFATLIELAFWCAEGVQKKRQHATVGSASRCGALIGLCRPCRSADTAATATHTRAKSSLLAAFHSLRERAKSQRRSLNNTWRRLRQHLERRRRTIPTLRHLTTALHSTRLSIKCSRRLFLMISESTHSLTRQLGHSAHLCTPRMVSSGGRQNAVLEPVRR